MLQNQAVKASTIIGTLVLIVYSYLNIQKLISVTISPKTNKMDIGQSLNLEAFEKSDKALSIKTKVQKSTFHGSFDPPFRQLLAAPVKRNIKKTNEQLHRKKLFLKGLLSKNNPLAIIEDEDGKTFISKVGEQIHNWKIIKIEETQVTIKDGLVKDVLKVKDE